MKILFPLFILLSTFFIPLQAQEIFRTYPAAGKQAVKIETNETGFNLHLNDPENDSKTLLQLSPAGDILSSHTTPPGTLQRSYAHGFYYRIDTLQTADDTDIQYTKYDADGTQIWQRTLVMPLDNYGLRIIPTEDDNLLLGGVTQVGADSLHRIFLAKMNQNGEVLWHNIIPKWATRHDLVLGYILGLTDSNMYPLKEPSLNKIYPLKNGGYLLKNSFGYNGGGVLRLSHNWIKTDAYGNVVWTNDILVGSKNIGTPTPSTGYSELQHNFVDSYPDGSVVITYNDKIGTASYSAAPIVKYNAAGEEEYSNNWGGGHAWRKINYGGAARPDGGFFQVMYDENLHQYGIGLQRNDLTVFGFMPNPDNTGYLPDANFVLDFAQNGYYDSATSAYQSATSYHINDIIALSNTKFAICGELSGENNPNAVDRVPFFAVYDLAEECDSYEKDFVFLGEYGGHTYFAGAGALTLPEALTAAEDLGGYLVSVNSPGENAFLNSKALGGRVLTGLNDTAEEGNFVWPDGNPLNYTNFIDCYPDCEDTPESDYIALDMSTGAWNFAKPLGDIYQFVVEVECMPGAELLPDLALNAVENTPRTATPGFGFSYSAEVANLGGAAQSGDFAVNVYLSADAELSAEDVQVGTQTSDDLAINEIQSFTVQVNVPSELETGFYYLILAADSDNTIAENKETNNFLVLPDRIEVQSPGIDLAINYLYDGSQSLAVQGEDLIIPVSVSNLGSEDLSAPVKIGIFSKQGFPYLSNPAQILALDFAGEYLLEELEAGVTDTLLIPVPIPLNAEVGQSLHYYFYLDYDNQLAEIKEDNNYRTNFTSYNVTGDNFVELFTQNIQYLSGSATQETTYQFTFDVVNDGTLPAAGDFIIEAALASDIYISQYEEEVEFITVSNLQPGEVRTLTANVPVPAWKNSPGNFRPRLEVDYADVFSESNEQNNILMGTENVPINAAVNPDLRLDNLTETPDTVTQGEVFFFYFDLHNDGDELAAGDYNIKMYLRRFPYYNFHFGAEGWEEVGIIQTGNTPPGSIPGVYGGITVPEDFPAGDWHLLLLADSEADIAELNEDNNYLTVPLHVLSSAADFAWELTCPEDITVEIGNAYEATVGWDESQIFASDNCEDELTQVTLGQSEGMCPGGLFPVGTDTISYGISGFCHDTYAEATCTFLVTVDNHPIFVAEEEVSLCAGDSYEGEVYFADAVLTDTVAYADFDSVFITRINVLEVFETTLELSSCNPDDVGTYTQVLTAQNGCDSLVVTTVTYSESTEYELSASFCTGESITVNGTVYDAENPTGQEIFPDANQFGCDSILNVALTFYEVYNEEINLTLQEGEFYMGVPLFADTLIIENYLSINNCDSVVTVNIEIEPLSIRDVSEAEFELTVFPNPTDGNTVTVSLQNTSRAGRLTVYNALGQAVHQQKQADWQTITANTFALKINGLRSGTYFVTVETEGKVLTRRLTVF